MAAVDNIVRLNIVQQTGSVSTTLTTIPLLLGTTNPGWDEDDLVHSYTSAADLLSDGFSSTSPEYLYALALTAQKTVPGEFLVGRRTAGREPGTVERDRVTVTSLAPNYLYRLTINGATYSYTSQANDTIPNVHQALYAAIQNDAAATVSPELTAASANLDVVGKMEGAKLTFTSVDQNLSIEQTQAPSVGDFEPLTVDELTAVQAQNDSWYGLILVQPTDADILTMAKWIAPQKKLGVAASATKAIFDAQSTDDVAAELHDKLYPVLLVASPVSAEAGIDAGWTGSQLPQTPGSNTWMFKPVAGFTPDKLTSSQIATACGVPVIGTLGKCANVYTEEANIPMMQPGVLSDGTYVDIKIGVDWLYFNLSASVFSALQGAIGKIPYTDLGVAILKSAVSSVLGTARDNGLINDGFTVDAPKVADVSASQRAKRIAPTISFNCVLKGAVHAVNIAGTVSV